MTSPLSVFRACRWRSLLDFARSCVERRKTRHGRARRERPAPNHALRRRQQAEHAELDVVRHVFVQEKVSVQQWTDWGYGYGYGRGWPYGFGYYHMWPGAPMTYTDVNQYHEGTLIIDLVDTRTKNLVFRGVGTAVVGGPESNAEKIREGVTKMMAEFPASGGHAASR